MSAHSNDSARRLSLPIVAGDGAVRPKAWMSVNELDATAAAEFAAGRRSEFLPEADHIADDDGVSRRSFVQLVGASLALGGLAGCKKPPEKIVPYTRRPPEVTPGNSLHFATVSTLFGFGQGLIVESHEGRPTKVEGNPDHPDSLGAAGVYDQAMIFDLYDPARAKDVRWGGSPASVRTVHQSLAALGETHKADGGARVRFLLEPSSSPYMLSLRERMAQTHPQARVMSWSAIDTGAAEAGAAIAFGKPLETRYDTSKAKVIVALDSDLIGTGAGFVKHARGFAAHREPGEHMNRLYVAEPVLTVTGSAADHRLRVRASQVGALAAMIAQELGKAGVADAAAAAGGARGQLDDKQAKWAAAVARDLVKNRGASLVVAGARQPAAVHALVQAINVALGNAGATVFHHAPMVHDVPGGVAALKSLADDITAGRVDTLVITARNPVYTAPADIALGDLLRRVKNVIYTSSYEDETAAAAGSFIPALHEFESWGDARATDGTVSIVQPLIAPLYVGMTAAEIVASFLGEPARNTYEPLKAFWKTRTNGGADFDLVWDKWLRDGVIPATAAPVESVAANVQAIAAALPAATSSGGGMEVLFAPCSKVFDGRFANNPWLQELPDPITKVTWDNVALVSPATAERLGIKAPSQGTLLNRPGMADTIAVDVGGRKTDAPVCVAPGMADDTVLVSLGYGRRGAAETVAQGVGFDAGRLRSSAAMWIASGGNAQAAGGRHQLAITQDHWRMEGRELAIELDAAAFAAGEHPAAGGEHLKPAGHGEGHAEEHGGEHSDADRTFGLHAVEANRGEQPSVHERWNPTRDDLTGRPLEYAWGMAIDLNKCTGCNACVIACQSENNIATVGKHNVVRGREMHWIRIDRYFTGDEHEPNVVNQPMGCVHCEAAPCEYVCPVNATVHSDEGLNEMVYNRCVGTRYCLNNCPYKARRFNFLNYLGELDAVTKMRMNPDVTVRSRGVMEKCSYCVQRIERKRIDTRIAGKTIQDGDVVAACQQTCPSDAITFGNINDPTSRVSKLYDNRRRYNLLHELNTRPRTVHLARVRNPNPEIA